MMNVSRLKSWLAAAVLLAVIVGFAVRTNEDRCLEAWANAGERSDGYLTDRAATPYLAMMYAMRHEPPANHRISRPDFIAACRAGAVWPITLTIAN
jgi:hypothetical protein